MSIEPISESDSSGIDEFQKFAGAADALDPRMLNEAVLGQTLFVVHPSSEHPGFWWAFKVTGEFLDGFRKPGRWCVVEWWMAQQPVELSWTFSKWNGTDDCFGGIE